MIPRTKDPIARRAVTLGDMPMIDIHLAATEHRLVATEQSLLHALVCDWDECSRCFFLIRDLARRGLLKGY